jgi:hypothetical protein
MDSSRQEPFRIALGGLLNIFTNVRSKKEIITIKLDSTKTFDMIEHSTIIQMMHELGFNDKWIS